MSLPHCKFRATFLVCLALALPATLPAQTTASTTNAAPVYPPPPAGVTALHDVVFGKGGDRDLHAEIAYPSTATKPLPAVIYIHGGGWIKGSYKGAPVIYLAQNGYFAASIEYRLSNVAKWSAQLDDCRLAVRWLRANAAKYNIDPNHIGVWGPSAGGHLVSCLGTMTDEKDDAGNSSYPGVSSAVQAVVDWYGPVDFTRPDIYTPEATKYTQGLFGVPYAQNPDLWKSGSPVCFVKAGDPPMFLVHGDSDTLVPLAQSTALEDALTKAGVPHQLLVVKNAGHDLKPNPGAAIVPGYRDIQKAVIAFFDKYLKAP